MDIDAYRNYGIFTTKSKLEKFKELSRQVGLEPESFIELFISDLCDSFRFEEYGLYREEQAESYRAARDFFEAYKVISRRTNGNLEAWIK